jgi:hypothetical protein
MAPEVEHSLAWTIRKRLRFSQYSSQAPRRLRNVVHPPSSYYRGRNVRLPYRMLCSSVRPRITKSCLEPRPLLLTNHSAPDTKTGADYSANTGIIHTNCPSQASHDIQQNRPLDHAYASLQRFTLHLSVPQIVLHPCNRSEVVETMDTQFPEDRCDMSQRRRSPS